MAEVLNVKLLSQAMQRALQNKGLITKQVYKGYYSVTDECFYTRSQVELRDGRYYSLETGSETELTEEENYMFPLSKLQEALTSLYSLNKESALIPDEYAKTINKILHDGLDDLSVSRPRHRLHWGIPVPDDPNHTIYVWVDALVNYLTATGYPWDANESSSRNVFWPPDIQVIGKDIVR
jgi:methionyl-tRNA synthetase